MWLMVTILFIIAVLTSYAFTTDNQQHTYTCELICRVLCVCMLIAYFDVIAAVVAMVLTYVYFRFVRKYD